MLHVHYESSDPTGFLFSLTGPTCFAGGSDMAWYPQFGNETRGIGHLRFELPAGQTVIASGKRQGANDFTVEAPLHFSFAAGQFLVTRLGGKIPVVAYTLRARPDLNAYLAKLQGVLNVLTENFGPYPFDGFSIIEIPQDQANNAGFDGASEEGMIYADSPNFDGGFSMPFFAHELGHQWWGDLVTSEGDAGNGMLDEAMAQWGALSVVGRLEGDASAERFRRTGYPGYASGQSARGYFLMSSAGLDHPLAALPADSFVSHELATSKGFLTLDLLSRTIGKERFTRVLQAIAAEYAYRAITWKEFLEKVQRGAGRDLSTFYAEWFNRTGAPDLQPHWSQTGHRLNLSIRQSNQPYALRLSALLRGERGEQQTVSLAVAGEDTEIAVNVKFRVTAVELDPHYEVLHWTPAFQAEAKALAKVTAAKFLENDGKHAEAKQAFEQALANIDQPDRWGAIFLAQQGLAVSNLIDGNWAQDKAHLLLALGQPSRPAEDLPWTYERLAVAAKNLNDADLEQWAIESAIAADAELSVPTGAGNTARALKGD